MEKEENRPKALTALTLKNTIEHSTLFKGEGTLLCIDNCSNCYFQSDIASPFEAYENRIDLHNTKVYTLDAQESLVQQENGRYHDKKICLVMHFYKNGSSTQLILENTHGIYFLPAFFGEASRVSSLEEAKELWLENSRLAAGSGDFY